MSNKQRAKIYRQAAEMLMLRVSDYCCVATQKAAELLGQDVSGVPLYDFPELFMFRYKSDGGTFWWAFGDGINTWEQRQDCRILALLLSEQIALNP